MGSKGEAIAAMTTAFPLSDGPVSCAGPSLTPR